MTKKIAVACFVGGALCCAVALMAAPSLWWFGFIAGFAGGYISYEFREFLRAISVALRAAGRGGIKVWDGIIARLTTVIANAKGRVKRFFSRPHPFFYPAAIIVAALYGFLGAHDLAPYVEHYRDDTVTMISFFVLMACAVVLFGFITFIASWLIAIPAFIGARSERCFWWPFLGVETSNTESKVLAAGLEAKGLRREPQTYRNVGRWFAKGLGLILLFFVWTIWKYLVIAVVDLFCFLGRFGWHLFKLVHKHERLLCGIDGTIGGAVSYLLFATPHMPLATKGVIVLFGGLLGAAFGALNYEVVSKRILHLPVSHASV